MWTVLGTIGGIFLGALLGALFGYWFALHQQAQELSARREVLLGQLNREMMQIAPTLGPYEVGKVYYRDPIRLKCVIKVARRADT